MTPFMEILAFLSGGGGPPQSDVSGHPFSGIGMISPGNIDYAKEQGPVFNPDGSVSTVKSMVFGNDAGNSVIAPTVYDGGHHSPDEAVARYYKTGKSMGEFRGTDQALEFERALHDAEVKRMGDYLKSFPPPGGSWRQGK